MTPLIPACQVGMEQSEVMNSASSLLVVCCCIHGKETLKILVLFRERPLPLFDLCTGADCVET